MTLFRPDSSLLPVLARDLLGRSTREPELRQSGLRILLSALAIFYVLQFAWSNQNQGLRVAPEHLVAMMAAYFCAAVVLFLLALFDPTRFPRHRFAALGIDLLGIGLLLHLSGESAAPIMSALFLATVSHGASSGRRFMAITLTSALLIMASLWLYNPFWNAHPYLSALMAILIVVLPVHASGSAASIRTANRQLNERVVARSRLLTQASHDLRHPLHALGIFSARLASTALDHQQRRLVDQIELSLRNTTEMLQAYLDFTSIEANQLNPLPTVFPLQRLFDELSEQGRGAADRAGVQFCFMRTSRHVRADRTLLRAMLQNLIANVVHHAPGARALVGCRLQGNRYILQVRDNGGNGPARQSLDSLPINHGLGLTIVRDLARTQNLGVWINTETKCFDVRILGLIPAPANEAAADVPAAFPAFQPLLGTRVILVEANDSLRAETTELLHSWGCKVRSSIDVPDTDSDCDVLIVHLGLRTKASSRSIQRFTIPTILISDPSERNHKTRPRAGKMIQAVRPVTPTQLRSMLMSLR